jgi:hypothetical protein
MLSEQKEAVGVLRAFINDLSRPALYQRRRRHYGAIRFKISSIPIQSEQMAAIELPNLCWRGPGLKKSTDYVSNADIES